MKMHEALEMINKIATAQKEEIARLRAVNAELLAALEAAEEHFEILQPLDHPKLPTHELVSAAIARAKEQA